MKQTDRSLKGYPLLAAWAICMLLTTACSHEAAVTVPVLTVEGGQIAGKPASTQGVSVYMGIPYAAPPIGDLRWRAPQPVVPWEGVRDCSQPGAACVQTGQTPGTFYWKEFYQGGDPERSEDCLFLNVWTPAAGQADAHLPVMVWIHGGAFNHGYGHELEFDGEAIARHGAVLVTLNYRLGMLGFLAHPLLTAENGGKGSGNYGLLDQLAALKWVHNNIEAFGGDPSCVTVFGQSAGAGSVKALISSPLTQGLIQRSIIQSGGGLGGIIGARTLAEAEAFGQGIWDQAGINSLDEMRAADPEQFEDILNQFLSQQPAGTGLSLPYGPIVDGELLTAQLDETALAGGELDIPYLIGYTSDDLMPEVMHRAATDWSLLLERQGRQPAYVYRFARDLPGEDLEMDPEHGIYPMPGAFHSSELWYVFGTLDRCWRPMEQADYDLSEQMVAYWTNFARTGNPNGEGLPSWQSYTQALPEVHEFK